MKRFLVVAVVLGMVCVWLMWIAATESGGYATQQCPVDPMHDFARCMDAFGNLDLPANFPAGEFCNLFEEQL